MEEKSCLLTLKPKNTQLQKHIAYYYFHTSNSDNHSEAFCFYPNYLHALTIYKGSDVLIADGILGSKVRPSINKEQFTFLYTVNLKDKFHVKIEGMFHKIGIVFYPLGFNHFISQPLNKLMLQSFQEIILPENFIHIISSLSKNATAEEQREIIENALLSIYTPFQEERLELAIKKIILSNGVIKVEELEHLTSVNRKMLLRLFKKHTLASIEEYKKMVMFRNSLNYALQNKELVNLTDIALYNMYYDQSHFIKHFKSITKETPKTLLPKIAKIGNENLYWHYLKS